jgi:molybdenum cofactor biosynthesis enzyme MoaA
MTTTAEPDAGVEQARPDAAGLLDRYGRTAVDLRISLTDRCNLRCTYCMPAEGLPWLPKPELLTDDEVIRLATVAVQRLGVTQLRFTGGEPLLRRGLVDIVAAGAALRPRPRLALTTNGIGLERLAGPLATAGLDRENMVTADEILAWLSRHHDLAPDPAHRGSAPAQTWVVDGGPATVGIIASVSRPFCGDCDRTRLTADGQVRSCLFSRDEADLRGLLRAGATDDELAAAWRAAMWAKAPGHAINDPTFLQPTRPMSAIGG